VNSYSIGFTVGDSTWANDRLASKASAAINPSPTVVGREHAYGDFTHTAVFIASPLYKLEILSDQVIANSGGTFTESAQVRETSGSTVTTSTEGDNGTWVQHGSQIDLTSASDGTVTSATISGSKLTVNAQGVLGVYTRQ
jgi:hypothetical protein